jgi:iron complex outermembrane receptor protein
MSYRTAVGIRAILLAGVAAVSTPAIAQDQPAPDPTATAEATTAPNDDSDDSAGTGEIVVTARRTEESLQRVPASVSAFDARALDRIQATDPTGLQGAVPNLNIVQGRGSSNAMNIYIRGIGQPDALQTFDPAVGVYVDDVYLSRIRGTQLDLLDLERVEVLRGPQGTLYGKNTIGGALKFVSRKPGQQFRASGSIAVGSYDQFELKGSASGPISETLAAGFAVMRAKRDGFVEDSADDREYNDKDTIAGRAALAFTPSSSVRVDLTADYAHDDAKLNVGQPLNSLTYLIGGGTLLALPSNPDPDDYNFKGRTTPGLPNSTKLTHWGLAGTAAIDLTEGLTLKSITAYRKLKTDDYVDIDATEKEVGDVFVGVDQKQLSQEFQLEVNTGPLSGVAGLYYLKENIKSHQEAFADDLIGPLLGNPTFLRTIDDDLETTSYAAYANASFEITPELRLSAGARYTHEKKDYFRTTSTFSSSPLLTSVTPFLFDVKDHWNDFSPMASIDYQIAPNVMIYARAAKGFKSGGFNGRANSVAERTQYDPEKVTSYEIGLRSTIADQLRFNLTGFYNDYKDFQARVAGTGLDPVTDLPSPVLSVINAGELRIKGVEMEAAWTPIKEVLVDAQVGYLNADYKDFDDGRFPDGSRAFQTPAFAPKWTMRFGAQYSLDLGGSGSVTLGGQTRYKSNTALAVDNTIIGTTTEIDGLFQPGYWLHDARIVWEDAARHFAIGLYGNNLADKRYKTDGQEFSSIGSIRTVYYGAPRTFTLRLTARY